MINGELENGSPYTAAFPRVCRKISKADRTVTNSEGNNSKYFQKKTLLSTNWQNVLFCGETCLCCIRSWHAERTSLRWCAFPFRHSYTSRINFLTLLNTPSLFNFNSFSSCYSCSITFIQKSTNYCRIKPFVSQYDTRTSSRTQCDTHLLFSSKSWPPISHSIVPV